MPVFDGEEWQAGHGDVEIEVTSRHMVDVQVSCTKTVQLLGVPGTPGTSAVVLKTGTEWRFRGPVKNFEKIVIRGTGQTPFGFRIDHSPRQHGEPLSDERPPVVDLPEPSNLVAKMRRMAQDHHRFSRMPVLEPEDGPSFARYEYEDEDELDFEEEAYEKALARREKEKEEKAKSKGRKEPEDVADPPAPEPPEEPAPPKKQADPPPPAKAAE